jgi:hypothetical protein
MVQRPEMPERQSTPDQHPPTRRQARLENRAPLLALGVFLLVFLVALGSSRSLAHVAGPSDLANARLVVGDLIVLIVGFAVIPAVLYVIWQSLREFRGDDVPSTNNSREKNVIKLVLIMALVAGALAAIALSRPQNNSPVPRKPAAKDTRATSTPPRSRSTKTAEKLAPWVAGGVGACFVLLIASGLVQRRRRGPGAPELPEDELESPRRELHELVGISIAEIERESDPRRAVIRAYAGMETTLAKHRLGRRPFEAPGEYLARVFGALQVSRRPSERLTELFEQARFSTHAIGPEMKRESIAALGELRSELETKPR